MYATLIKYSPFTSLFFFTISGICLVLLSSQRERIQRLQNSLKKMKESFNDLDEQAKLIIKTDLELNRAQEELDRRLHGLDCLQKAARLISTTLDEAEIFNRLNASFMGELGYERSFVCTFNVNFTLVQRCSIGFSPEDSNTVLSDFPSYSHLLDPLQKGETFSSISANAQQRDTILRLFGTSHFVITPILTQRGANGFIFVGNYSNTSAITTGDEELVSILASQLGQSLENARLFEQVFSSGKIMESQVQDRTQQLTSALEDVQVINRAKSDFISAVSHELRTPLTSIKGYASILIAGKLGNVPPPVKERLEKINYHTDNLVKLINNMLDISRIESKRIEMNLASQNISGILDNIGDLLAPQMQEKRIKWIVNIPENFPELILDRNQIERVFINIIGNAIKFTPPDGSITVNVKNDRDKRVIVEISDTGLGIDEDDIERLFEEFFRVDNKENEQLKGTGLGLSLVKKIIEAHDGKIWVTSTVGVGTTFHFTIPLYKRT